MPYRMLIPFILVLTTCISFLNAAENDRGRIRKLEKTVKKIEILVPGEDFSEKVKELKNATRLYEEISNKDAVPDAFHKKIGIYYLYLREREEASGILNDYLADHPEDGEAIFYRGIIARFSNEPYCDDLKKAE